MPLTAPWRQSGAGKLKTGLPELRHSGDPPTPIEGKAATCRLTPKRLRSERKKLIRLHPCGSNCDDLPMSENSSHPEMPERQPVEVTINGMQIQESVEPRMLLTDFLRDRLGMTGTHVGCEHGVCGACTVMLNGEPIRACLMFAIQADGMEILTVEGLASGERLHPVQEAFRAAHGLRCGFCTPGILLTVVPFLQETPHPSEEQIREVLGGNLCRCTGYQKIVEAVQLAAQAIPGPVAPDAGEGN